LPVGFEDVVSSFGRDARIGAGSLGEAAIHSLVFAKTKNKEHNLNAAGNAELIENPKQVILHGMLGKSQGPCDLPIGQAFRHRELHRVPPLKRPVYPPIFPGAQVPIHAKP
jgi:hypothetical protein